MSKVPNLPPHCNSWIVRDRTNGQAVAEIYSLELAEHVRQDKYEVLTAADHLASLNP